MNLLFAFLTHLHHGGCLENAVVFEILVAFKSVSAERFRRSANGDKFVGANFLVFAGPLGVFGAHGGAVVVCHYDAVEDFNVVVWVNDAASSVESGSVFALRVVEVNFYGAVQVFFCGAAASGILRDMRRVNCGFHLARIRESDVCLPRFLNGKILIDDEQTLPSGHRFAAARGERGDKESEERRKTEKAQHWVSAKAQVSGNRTYRKIGKKKDARRRVLCLRLLDGVNDFVGQVDALIAIEHHIGDAAFANDERIALLLRDFFNRLGDLFF